MAGSPELSFDPASMSNAVCNTDPAQRPQKNSHKDSNTKTIEEKWSDSEESDEELDWGDWREWPRGISVLVFAVLDDCIENIISDTVLKVHREEKQARMQSAAILAQQTKDTRRAEASPGGAPTSIKTDSATIDEDDRILLRSNPLRSINEILCPTCRLPRLLYPTMGKGARPPDPTKEYCARQPYVDKDGCDIYGKSLTQERPSKKKAAADKKARAGSRSGSESPTGSPANGKDAGPKPASTAIPSGKCPYCPRYMAFTRLAQHMDRCMRSQTRQSQSQNTNKNVKNLQASTPQSTSRASTPKPSASAGVTNADKSKEKDKDKSKKRKLAAGSDGEDAVDVTPVKKKKVKKEKAKESTPVPESKKEKKDRVSGTPKPKNDDK